MKYNNSLEVRAEFAMKFQWKKEEILILDRKIYEFKRRKRKLTLKTKL